MYYYLSMKTNKKLIYIIIGLILVTLLWRFSVLVIHDISMNKKSNYIIESTLTPRSMIEKSFNIKLPNDCKISNYEYDEYLSYYDAKILIKIEYKEQIEEQLLNFFKQPHRNGYSSQDFMQPPNFSNAIEWWDLNRDNVAKHNFAFISGGIIPDKSTALSYQVWIFITENNNDTFFLYISSTGLPALYPEIYYNLYPDIYSD
jgi:hypothetical protein